MSVLETFEKSTQHEPAIAEWWPRASTRLPQLPAKSNKAQLTAWGIILLDRFDALPKPRRILAQTIGASVRTVSRVLKLSPLDRLAVAEGYVGLYPKRPKRPIADTAVLDFVRRVGPDRVVDAAREIEREIGDQVHKTCEPELVHIARRAGTDAVKLRDLLEETTA